MVNCFIKFNRKNIKNNNIKTRTEPKIFYRKSIGILLEITLGNIKKKRSKLKELNKGDK